MYSNPNFGFFPRIFVSSCRNSLNFPVLLQTGSEFERKIGKIGKIDTASKYWLIVDEGRGATHTHTHQTCHFKIKVVGGFLRHMSLIEAP